MFSQLFKSFKYIHPEDIFFVVLLVFAFIQTLATYSGLGVGDAGEYVNAAYSLTQGHIPITENFYSNRIGTVAPFALAMKMLGWYGLQLTYVSTFIFLTLMVFVYTIVSRYNRVVALFAVALLSVSKAMLESSTAVMGDMTITLLANAPVLVYFYFINSWNKGVRRSPELWGVLTGILFVAAVLTKESIAFYLPFLMWLAWRDRKDEKNRFWISMFGISIIAGLLIGFWYLWMTGDFFYRIHGINSGNSQSDCNYATAPWWLILKRITYQPFQFLIEDYGFGLLFLLSVLNLLKKNQSKELQFFKWYLLFALTMWWVAPQGLPWNPVALVHRLWLPLMVPLSINAAIFLNDVISDKLTGSEKKILGGVWVVLLILTACFLYQLRVAYMAVNQPQNFVWIAACYAIIGAVFLISLVIKDEFTPYYLPTAKKMLLPLIILSLIGYMGILRAFTIINETFHAASPTFNYTINIDYYREKEMILYVESLNPTCVLTDNNLSRKYHIYDGFKRDYPFKDWSVVNANSIPQSAYLFINKTRLKESRRNLPETLIYTQATGISNYNAIPDYVNNPENFGFILIKNTSSHQVWQKR